MSTLQVQSRDRASSADVRRLRLRGILPMALIVKGKGTRLIQATLKDVRSALQESSGAAVFGVSLNEESKTINVVVKDIQRDSISRNVTHITLQEVKDDEVIRISVPVHIQGEPDCVAKKRSSLVVAMSTLEIYAKPGDIPDAINLDVSGLTDHDKIVLGDVTLPNGVTTHLPADSVVVTTTILRAVSLEAPVTATTEVAAVPAADATAKPDATGAKKPSAPTAKK